MPHSPAAVALPQSPPRAQPAAPSLAAVVSPSRRQSLIQLAAASGDDAAVSAAAAAAAASPVVLPPTPGLYATPPAVGPQPQQSFVPSPPPGGFGMPHDPFATPPPEAELEHAPLVELHDGIVLYTFTAEADSEVSVRENQVVLVRFEDGVKHVAEGWVTVTTRDGTTGLVPETYVAVE